MLTLASALFETGLNIFIHCTSKNRESNTKGNGAVDREGKFNVTLFTEITKNGSTIEGCFAKLQSTSAATCPLKTAQIASLKLFSSEENSKQSAHNSISRQIKFSPVTCQSAFYWPFIKHPSNLKYLLALLPSPGPPTGYAPPSSQTLPPPPVPPVENVIPPPAPASTPAYLPPIPSLAPTNSPPFFKQPFYQTPSVSPIPAPPIGILTPHNHRKPNAIPRAPPVPQLPPIPTVPRKYFNTPNPESQPPHPPTNPSHYNK
ncbi:hypothetical protein BUALT_Bualt15G0017000 [Buddleja alternifolia]|uniref:Uncharacterized protein n=1 Tax=Buddleja alternifolia TaxID=168488 RepID=A0AAV6WML6_9LAMI|nr:hypothetical protein BUALT_Bualt15G0017000 [Buddleja alternifolia]